MSTDTDLPPRDEITVSVRSRILCAMAKLVSTDEGTPLNHVLIETELDSTAGWVVAGNGKRMACWYVEDVLERPGPDVQRVIVPMAMIEHLRLEVTPESIAILTWRPVAARLSAIVDLTEVSTPCVRSPEEYPLWQVLMDTGAAPAAVAGHLLGTMNTELLRNFGEVLKAAKAVNPDTTYAFDLYRSGGASGKLVAVHPECPDFRGVLMPIHREDTQLTLTDLFRKAS